jgi:non-specific serine/threonine protein kinase
MLDRLEAEQGNLQSVLGWALEREDAELTLRLAGALWPFWRFRFYSRDGLIWLRRALALDGEVSPWVVRRALFAAGLLAWVHGEYPDAERLLLDALARYGETDAPRATGRVELALGRLAWDQGGSETAQHRFESAILQFKRADDAVGIAHGLHGMGLVAQKNGENRQAARHFRDALSVWQSLGFTWDLACCIPGHLADVARAEGDLGKAMTLYQECLSCSWRQRDIENVAWSLVGLAVVLAVDGQAEDSARLVGLVDQLQKRIGAPLMPDVGRDYAYASQLSAAVLGTERFRLARANGTTTKLSDAVAQACAFSRDGLLTHAEPVPALGLTPREREVLHLMATGRSNRDIADALFISPGTVKVHVTHILSKLGVPSRSAATDYAHRHALI